MTKWSRIFILARRKDLDVEFFGFFGLLGLLGSIELLGFGKLIHLSQDSSISVFEIDTLFLKFSFQSFNKNLPHRLLGFVESIGLLEFVGFIELLGFFEFVGLLGFLGF